MSMEAMAVVGLPLSVVETQLWDITQWPTFLAGLQTATRSSHERYVFTVRQGRKDYDVLVAVRWQARDHRFTWRSLEGPPWDGTLRLAPVNGRRTRVFLQRKAYPRSFFASMAELLGAGVADPSLDLQRLQDRLAVLPAPARPARLRSVDAAERAARTQRIAEESGRAGAVTTHGLPTPRTASDLVVPDPA
ncbi:MAG: hypothetical protein HY830_18205 [Actinobacteria bacterium]|nr:hypothetical protein [Actinomycetota bacterium]